MTHDHHTIAGTSVRQGTELQRSARASDSPRPSAKDGAASKKASSAPEWDSWKSARDLG